MEKVFFSLEIRDNNRLTRLFQLIFGIICIAIAIFWLVYNFKSVESDWTLWITVLFLIGFGAFQVWSGFGYSERFIETGPERIRLKQNSILPAINMGPENIEVIEIYPLKVIFRIKGKAKILFRLGVTETEKADRIKDEIIRFCDETAVPLEIKNEE